MAIRWNWDEKCGEITERNWDPETKEEQLYTFTMYDCNGLAVWLWENDTLYGVRGIFADEEHAKKCLGLSKDYKDNIHENWVKIKLNVRYPKMKKLAQLIVKAFDNIQVELYNEGERK